MQGFPILIKRLPVPVSQVLSAALRRSSTAEQPTIVSPLNDIFTLVSEHVNDDLVASTTAAARLVETLILPASNSPEQRTQCAVMLAELRCAAATGLCKGRAPQDEVR